MLGFQGFGCELRGLRGLGLLVLRLGLGSLGARVYGGLGARGLWFADFCGSLRGMVGCMLFLRKQHSITSHLISSEKRYAKS